MKPFLTFILLLSFTIVNAKTYKLSDFSNEYLYSHITNCKLDNDSNLIFIASIKKDSTNSYSYIIKTTNNYNIIWVKQFDNHIVAGHRVFITKNNNYIISTNNGLYRLNSDGSLKSKFEFSFLSKNSSNSSGLYVAPFFVSMTELPNGDFVFVGPSRLKKGTNTCATGCFVFCDSNMLIKRKREILLFVDQSPNFAELSSVISSDYKITIAGSYHDKAFILNTDTTFSSQNSSYYWFKDTVNYLNNIYIWMRFVDMKYENSKINITGILHYPNTRYCCFTATFDTTTKKLLNTTYFFQSTMDYYTSIRNANFNNRNYILISTNLKNAFYLEFDTTIIVAKKLFNLYPNTFLNEINFFQNKTLITGYTNKTQPSNTIPWGLGFMIEQNLNQINDCHYIDSTFTFVKKNADIPTTTSFVNIFFNDLLYESHNTSDIIGDTAYFNELDCFPLSLSSNVENHLSNLIHPNPTSGIFYIKGNQTETYTITMFDLNGRQVFSNKVKGNEAININHLSNTIYIAKVEDVKGNSQMYRLLKQ